jgi:glycosyltransferase involved in cell wall biosynthesis
MIAAFWIGLEGHLLAFLFRCIVRYRSMPKVSVIIPTYNCAHHLEQAIESAINQTYRDLEIIVIDDGSTDNTSQVVRKYETTIRYIWQENCGVSAARNHAIKSSAGELIAFLDADDWWEPTKLAEQVSLIAKDPELCLIYSDLDVSYDDGSVVHSFLSSRPLAAGGYVFDQLLESGFIIPSTVLLRRDCLEQVGMFDESMRSHEDLELWLRLCRIWKVALVRKALTHRRQGTANLTSNTSLRTEYGIKFLLKTLSMPNITTTQRLTMVRQLGKAYFSRGYYYFTEGEMEKCREALRQSLYCSAWNPKAWTYYAASFCPGTLIGFIRRYKRILFSRKLPTK